MKLIKQFSSGINVYEYSSVLIGIKSIEKSVCRENRRQTERKVVAEIVKEMLGPEKVVGHKADGAPDVEGIKYISITHSQRMAAIAISDKFPIGIDMEEWRSALERVKGKFLSAEEMEWCDDLLLAWTIKEAVYKAAGIRSLAGAQIHISPSYEKAEVDGVNYQIKSRMIGESRLTLAIKE